MSDIPKVSIGFSNGNLLQNIIAPDGYGAMLGTGMQSGNIGKVFIINSLAEAEGQGITIAAEPYAYRHIKEFYQELAGNMRLYVQLFAASKTMAQMLDSTSATAGNLLMQTAFGEVSLLAVWKNPEPGYSAGSAFFDSDVPAAVTAAKTFCQYWGAKNVFTRVLIEGRVADESAITNIYSPSAASNGYAGVLAGGTQADKSASVGLFLGRKMKYAAHIKAGKVANGALSATAVYIGTKAIAAAGGDTINAVSEVKATATLTIANVGTDGDVIWLYATTPDGYVYLGSYTKVSGDTTVTTVATAFKNAINAGSHGYTAANTAGVITITAKAGLGATINTYALYVGISSGSTIAFTKTAFASGAAATPAQVFNSGIFADKGFITYVTYPNKAGFFFGIDKMASTDDYRLLVNGCVVDAAAKITNLVYTNELEGEVDTNANGTISEAAAVHLEERIIQQVKATMGERISDFTAYFDRTINIVNTSRASVKLRVLPKGYLTYIDVDLGLTASI